MELLSGKTMAHQGDGTTSFNAEPLRALVVDDHHPTLKVVYDMLVALGYRVDSANGGLAAIGCLRRYTYAVVVTNQQMADMDGYALARWLKRSTQHTKVVMMTACCHSEVATYMDTGIVDWWLFKPFSWKKLDGVVGNVMQNRVQAHPCRCASPDGRLSELVTAPVEAVTVQKKLSVR